MTDRIHDVECPCAKCQEERDEAWEIKDHLCQFCDKPVCPECNDCQNERCFESYHCKCLEEEQEEEDLCSCRYDEINPYCGWCFC